MKVRLKLEFNWDVVPAYNVIAIAAAARASQSVPGPGSLPRPAVEGTLSDH